MRPLAVLFLASLALPPGSAPLLAAEAPAAMTADVSLEVGTRLNAVIALMDAGDVDAAAAAMQLLRDEYEPTMTAYEKQVTLQTSASLNSTLTRYPEAVADYEALLALNVLDEASRHTTMKSAAQLYLQLQDWTNALQHLVAANAVQGGDMETLFRIAYAHSQRGAADAAIPYLEQAIAAGGEQTPEDYFRNLGLLYLQTMDPQKAVATYEMLLQRFPGITDREQVLANIAALHIQLGDKVKASSLLRRLLREYPTSDQQPAWRQSLDALTAN